MAHDIEQMHCLESSYQSAVIILTKGFRSLWELIATDIKFILTQYMQF